MFNLPSTPPERKVTYKYKSTAKYETPEVSIITPFYNVSDIFRETVSCILGQSFQNFEWIIVDDCSGNEESIAMLEEIKALDSRIKVIRADQNGGPGAARNIGIKQ